jgi:hypothetical protein
MRSQVEGAWTGWSGDTIVKLTNGTVWRQAQYYYRYQYKYRPHVIIDGGMMYVDVMPKAIKVRKID